MDQSKLTRTRARELRKYPTEAEKLLWSHLRYRQMGGFRFRRQHPIGGFIVDFACVEKRLVIEVDGSQHLDSNYDARRSAQLKNLGFKVIRFWNNQVLQELESVKQAIHNELLSPPETP